MHKKLVPDSFLILVYNPKQPMHARNETSFLKQEILKDNYQKAFKKLTLSFLLNPSKTNVAWN